MEVSVAGLGGGGPAQLGQRDDRLADADSVALVRRALDLGVNIIDTAESYLTEQVIGRAVSEFGRDRVVLATKKTPWHGSWREMGEVISPDELTSGLERSLQRLGSDHVDIYQLHALRHWHYEQAVETLVPAMQRLRDQGKIRFLGVTEEFIRDPGHQMLQLAVADDCWDTVMVGCSLLNPSARDRVLTPARERGIGTLIMFAVRRALSQPEKLREVIDGLVAEGHVAADAVDRDDPLKFLTTPGVAASLPEAAYRYCRHTPGADVVLTGTGNFDHLAENVASINAAPLPAAVLERLDALFGRLEHLSGN